MSFGKGVSITLVPVLRKPSDENCPTSLPEKVPPVEGSCSLIFRSRQVKAVLHVTWYQTILNCQGNKQPLKLSLEANLKLVLLFEHRCAFLLHTNQQPSALCASQSFWTVFKGMVGGSWETRLAWRQRTGIPWVTPGIQRNWWAAGGEILCSWSSWCQIIPSVLGKIRRCAL